MRRASSGRGRARRARVAVSIIVAIAFLVAPGTAAAHSGAPTVALDFQLAVSAATRALPGVRVDLVDGDRGLRLRVDPGTALVVLGDLGEPFLRFAADGVWVNRASPTAAAVKLVPPSTGTGVVWSLKTHGRSVRWHDHRLAPPRDARTGVTGRWSIPILLRGHRTALDGTYVRMRRPRYWLWLAAALVLAVGIGGAARVRPQTRPALLVLLGGLAAVGALAGSASFATADELGAKSQWVEFGVVVALLATVAIAARRGRRSLAVWVAVVTGITCATLSLGSLGVLWHGYIISSLPATAARLSVLLAVVAGMATGFLGISVDSAQVRGRLVPASSRRRNAHRRMPAQRAGARRKAR